MLNTHRVQPACAAAFSSALLLAAILFSPAATSSASAENGGLSIMIEANVRGQHVEGLPLAWNDEQIHLLSRDGYLWEFRPDEAHDLRKTAPSFRSYSFAELRSELQRELAGRLELTSTAHYLVAHPPGAGKKWADRFEELYRSFVHYFAVRGLEPKAPEFPLIAVVWESEAGFQQLCAVAGAQCSAGVVGLLLADDQSHYAVRLDQWQERVGCLAARRPRRSFTRPHASKRPSTRAFTTGWPRRPAGWPKAWECCSKHAAC